MLLLLSVCSDCLGDSSLAGDMRWAGTYGVNLDFVARSHCSIQFISIDAMQVCAAVQLGFTYFLYQQTLNLCTKTTGDVPAANIDYEIGHNFLH